MNTVDRSIKTAVVFLSVVIVAAISNTVSAIPQFAKKYSVACNACHVGVPKLNPFGEKFRMNSFQLPGTIETTPVWQQELLPLSGMPHPMYMLRNVKNNMEMTTPNGIPAGEELSINTFRAAFEFFSGGTVGPHLSYLAFLEIELEPSVGTEGEEPEEHAHPLGVSDNYSKLGKKASAATDGDDVAAIGTEVSVIFHQLFFTYNNLANIWGENVGNLNVRMGFFHLETPFNSLRKLTGHSSPYLAYSLSPVKGGFSLASRQLGVSVNGWLGSMRLGVEYEIAAVNGTNSLIDTNPAKDFYGRLAVNWRERLRVGILAYRGWQNILGGSNLKEHDDFFYRVGLDFSWQSKSGPNLFGQWIRGYDDDTDADLAGMQPFQFDGGFIEADVPLRTLVSYRSFLSKLMIVGRVDLISVSKQIELADPVNNDMLIGKTGDEHQIKMYTLALRYYFLPNVFLVLEGGAQDNKLGYPKIDEMFEVGLGRAGRVVDVDAIWAMAMVVVAF
ncbi:MAG: hypothetical protein V3U24_09120 [Candidatus Neomarinimicrobiota bacterium]